MPRGVAGGARKISVEYDRMRLRVVDAGENTLVECLLSDEPMLERIADTLAAHYCPQEADAVRMLLYGQQTKRGAHLAQAMRAGA